MYDKHRSYKFKRHQGNKDWMRSIIDDVIIISIIIIIIIITVGVVVIDQMFSENMYDKTVIKD